MKFYKVNMWILLSTLILFIMTGCIESTPKEVYYDVIFITQEDEVFKSVEVLEGATVHQPEDNPEQEGYIFMGWYTSKDNDIIYDFDNAIVSDTVIYAQWRKVVGTELSYQYSIHSNFDINITSIHVHSKMNTIAPVTVVNNQLIFEAETLKNLSQDKHLFEIELDSESIFVTILINDQTKPYVINQHALYYQVGKDVELRLELFDQMFISLSHNQMTTDDYVYNDNTLTIYASYLDKVLKDNEKAIMVLQYGLNQQYSAIFITILSH